MEVEFPRPIFVAIFRTLGYNGIKGGETVFDGKLVNLELKDIIPKKDQPRKTFDEYELKSLSESIRENGILQPLIVRKAEKGKYLLIAGERRLRAAGLIGLKKLPCIIRNADDITADLYTVIENLQRSDLTFFEEAEGISRLICCHGLSLTEVSERLGIAPSTLSNKLRILKLSSEIKERILRAGLTERHARALLKIPEEARKDALDHILAHQLNVAETDKYIEKLLSPPEKKTEPIRKAAIGDLRLFANSLTKIVDTMRLGGVTAKTTRHETETHIEYTVLISKQ